MLANRWWQNSTACIFTCVLLLYRALNSKKVHFKVLNKGSKLNGKINKVLKQVTLLQSPQINISLQVCTISHSDFAMPPEVFVKMVHWFNIRPSSGWKIALLISVALIIMVLNVNELQQRNPLMQDVLLFLHRPESNNLICCGQFLKRTAFKK